MIDAPKTPVLLVEDNFDLASNIQDYLEQRGWGVDYVPNGALALHRVNEQTHAAVILDLRLPVIDGLEVCRRLRNSIAPRIPVLMLTARGYALDAEDLAIGDPPMIRQVLSKPFSPRAIVEQIQRILNPAGHERLPPIRSEVA